MMRSIDARLNGGGNYDVDVGDVEEGRNVDMDIAVMMLLCP
jgi:hypothetical protein